MEGFWLQLYFDAKGAFILDFLPYRSYTLGFEIISQFQPRLGAEGRLNKKNVSMDFTHEAAEWGRGTFFLSPEPSGSRTQFLHILSGSRWLLDSPADSHNSADSFPGEDRKDVCWII